MINPETTSVLRAAKLAILTDDERITMTRQTMKNCWSLLWLVAIFASAYLGVLTAQAGEAPMTSMETGGALRRLRGRLRA